MECESECESEGENSFLGEGARAGMYRFDGMVWAEGVNECEVSVRVRVRKSLPGEGGRELMFWLEKLAWPEGVNGGECEFRVKPSLLASMPRINPAKAINDPSSKMVKAS